jgi:predicted transcriptional regulator
MQKDTAIGFRAPAALKQALERLAEADHRSLGQLCTLVLMEYLEKRGEWPPREQGAPRGAGRRRAKRE